MDTTEIIKELGSFGLVGVGAFFMIRYFMQQITQKDTHIQDIMERSILAIENNTKALSELKENIRDSRRNS